MCFWFQEVKSYVGHSEEVTAVCFVGPSHLVSASADGTLSLWHWQHGHRSGSRVRVTWQGHRSGSQAQAHRGVTGQGHRSGSLVCITYQDHRYGSDVMVTGSGSQVMFRVTVRSECHCRVTGEDPACAIVYRHFPLVICVADVLRVAVLKGHRRRVSCCVADPSGKVIISASWDGSVRIWDGMDGSLQGELKTQQ